VTDKLGLEYSRVMNTLFRENQNASQNFNRKYSPSDVRNMRERRCAKP